MAVAGVEMDHALQNLFCGFERTTGTQTLSGRGEELPCFGFLSQPDVNLGQARCHGCSRRIHFQNFLENPDRLLQFAGADKFLRGAEDLLFVEAKTKRHMSADSSSGSRCRTYSWKLFTDGLICTGPMSRETAAMIRGMVTVRQL